MQPNRLKYEPPAAQANKNSWVYLVLLFLLCFTLPHKSLAQNKLFWTQHNPMGISSVDLIDGQAVNRNYLFSWNTHWHIRVDARNRKIYYTDLSRNAIFKFNYDGSQKESLVELDSINPTGIALDVENNTMYWPDWENHKIQKANLDGTEIKDIVFTGPSNPSNIALDLSRKKIYWVISDSVLGHQIKRANLDGSQEEVVIDFEYIPVGGLAIHDDAGKIYWTAPHAIHRANLDGSAMERLIRVPRNIKPHIVLDPRYQKMYWADELADSSKIYWSNLDGTGIHKLLDLNYTLISFDIPKYQSVKLPRQNRIKGKIFVDKNANCQPDGLDQSLTNWVVRAEPGGHYAVSNFQGEYTLLVDSGTYQLSIHPPFNSPNQITPLTNCSNNSQTVELSSFGQELTGYNWAVANALEFDCAALKVDISADPFIRCFTGNTYLEYHNTGTLTALNARIEVKLPEYIIPVSSSPAWTHWDGETLIYELGEVAPGQVSRIVIRDSVSCDNGAFNQTQCLEARIFPETACVPASSDWSGADLIAYAKCRSTFFKSALLTIKNQGEGDMKEPQAYRIYASDTLLYTSEVQLAAGDSLVLNIPIDGQEVRLEVDQVPYHPHNQMLSASSSRCGSPQSFVASGFANKFAQNDDNYAFEMTCQDIVGSYDPNDKLVSPVGFTDQHYVNPGTRMEYTIRFQNTGTFKAFNVWVHDTLSSHWDMTSFEMQSSSHDYTLDLLPDGAGNTVAIWSFPDINLPDSTNNEPESHGYIKFKISPKADLAIGTQVENFADIYFDYNDPIRTNTTHTTFEEYVFPQPELALDPCTLVSPAKVGKQTISCASEAILTAEIPVAGEGAWTLLDGQAEIVNPHSPISYVGGLSPGIYTFRWEVGREYCDGNYQDYVLEVKSPPSPASILNPRGNLLQASKTGTKYVWFFNEEQLPDNTQVIFAEKTGEYKVEVADAYCFSAPSEPLTFQVLENTGEDLSRTYGLMLKSNPTQGVLKIHLDTCPADDLEIRIRDYTGKITNTQIINAQKEMEMNTELDLEALDPGIYMLEILWDAGHITQKIIRN